MIFHTDRSKTIVRSIIVTFISCIHISLVDRIRESINSKEKNNEQRVTDRLFSIIWLDSNRQRTYRRCLIKFYFFYGAFVF